MSRGDNDGRSTGGVETFPRSSADLDQALRDMLRRSPRPLLGVIDLPGEVGVGGSSCRRSMVVLARPVDERSRTDLDA